METTTDQEFPVAQRVTLVNQAYPQAPTLDDIATIDITKMLIRETRYRMQWQGLAIVLMIACAIALIKTA